jgi:hypothetical protein
MNLTETGKELTETDKVQKSRNDLSRLGFNDIEQSFDNLFFLFYELTIFIKK